MRNLPRAVRRNFALLRRAHLLRLGASLLLSLVLVGCQDLLEPERAAKVAPDAELGASFSTLAGGIETQITTDPGRQYFPDISGQTIVWQDLRHGNWDVYAYDLSSGTETRLTTHGAHQLNPAVSGNTVVWHDARHGNWDIYAYNLSSGTETRLTTNGANQLNPAVSGNTVVWQDTRHGNYEIYAYDLSSGTETRLTTHGAHQSEPAISGTTVVWQDTRHGNWDIYTYDLSSGTETRITTDAAHQYMPAISGTTVVWQDNRHVNWDIYAYDLSSGTETRVTTNGAYQLNPAVYGSTVVWEDARNGNPDIYAYDLNSGTETLITTSGPHHIRPAISGTYIVWMDYRNGNYDIYHYGTAVDSDNDGVADGQDNCPATDNPNQTDTDEDGAGDACDEDDDGDGILDEDDNAPLVANPDQTDTDGDGIGDAADPDDDNDGVADEEDNAPLVPNPDQEDTDGDGIGDVADSDLDGDGVTNDSDNCPALHNPDQKDSDGDGQGDVCDLNEAPTADAGGPYTAVEGASVQFDGSASDDPDGDALTYAWDFDNDGTVDETTTSETASHTYADNGVYIVTLTVDDGNGESATAQTEATIKNVAPTVDAGADASIDEGSALTRTASFIDPGADTWSATVDYGDGSGAQSVSVSGKNVPLSHSYVDNGSYTVTVEVTDDDGGTGSASFELTVVNVAPSLSASLDRTSIYSGEAVNLSATFSDPGVNDAPWGYEIDWSDGTPTTTGTGALGNPIGASHSYLAIGSFAVEMSLTEKDGGSDSESLSITVKRLPVQIDIKPDGTPNAVNPRNKGLLPVAILSADAANGTLFDATQVDVSTVRFGIDEASEAHGRGHPEDVDGDGDLDLVLHFDTQASGIQCGDTSATLTGTTTAGVQFTATDSVETKGCNGGGNGKGK